MRSRLSLAAFFLGLCALSSAGAGPLQEIISCPNCAEWNQPQTPFRIFGNTYYVGTHALSSILITSPGGHILIDGDLPQSANQIAANIRTLGFRIEDVKLIANSHVHFDHAGGIATLQRLSRAKVVASPWSAKVLEKGGVAVDDPQYGTIPGIPAVRNVHLLHDGESFSVGTTGLTAHLTPGHTPGGTSWTWRSCEGEKCYDMVYADSLSPISGPNFRFSDRPQHPRALADFEVSFHFLETTPCDVLLTPHPETSGLWDRVSPGGGVPPSPLADPASCKQLAANAREKLRERQSDESKPPH
jgi:metallo-beta-lactamase class B